MRGLFFMSILLHALNMRHFANLESAILLGNFKEKYQTLPGAQAVAGMNANHWTGPKADYVGRVQCIPAQGLQGCGAVGLGQGPSVLLVEALAGSIRLECP